MPSLRANQRVCILGCCQRISHVIDGRVRWWKFRFGAVVALIRTGLDLSLGNLQQRGFAVAGQWKWCICLFWTGRAPKKRSREPPQAETRLCEREQQGPVTQRDSSALSSLLESTRFQRRRAASSGPELLGGSGVALGQQISLGHLRARRFVLALIRRFSSPHHRTGRCDKAGAGVGPDQQAEAQLDEN